MQNCGNCIGEIKTNSIIKPTIEHEDTNKEQLPRSDFKDEKTPLQILDELKQSEFCMHLYNVFKVFLCQYLK